MHAETFVVGHVHRLGSRLPGSRFVRSHAEPSGDIRPADAGGDGGAQIAGCHQIGEHVVVGDRAVLVRTGHTVLMPDPVAVWWPCEPTARAVSMRISRTHSDSRSPSPVTSR
jgi:hypothetical protein